MKKGVLIIFLITILLSLSFVSAVEVIEEDIGDYVFSEINVHTPRNFFPINTLNYYNNLTNTLIEVQIIEFNESERLDEWINIKIREAKGILNISNRVIFITGNNKYVFWRNGPIYIQISEKHQKSTLKNPVDFIGSSGTGNFETGIINEYLRIYQSDCNENSCTPPVALGREEIYTFDEPADIFWKVKQHTDGWYQCPKVNSVSEIKNKVNELLIIKDRITDGNIKKLKEECDNSNLFLIKGIEAEGEIKECFDYLSRLLEGNGLSAPDIIWLYKECYIRSYFKERFNPETLNDYNISYFKDRLNERDIEFTDFIKYKTEFPKSIIEEATEEGKEQTILEERNVDIKEVEDNASELEKYEFLPTETEEIKIPSKSLLQVIKEKIKGFFEWFK